MDDKIPYTVSMVDSCIIVITTHINILIKLYMHTWIFAFVAMRKKLKFYTWIIFSLSFNHDSISIYSLIKLIIYITLKINDFGLSFEGKQVGSFNQVILAVYFFSIFVYKIVLEFFHEETAN